VVPEAAFQVDPDALDACVDEILDRLASAKSPVLMAGVEVRRYGLEDKVATLSRRLGLPVVTSFMGRGLLADQDAPLVGTYMGEIICDTNFAVSETKIDMRKTIQALNGQVNIGYHTYANLPLAAVVNRMLARVPGPDKAFSVTPQSFPTGLAEDATARCRWPPTWATACSPPWKSATPRWSRPATTPPWVLVCPRAWACKPPPVNAR